MIQHIYRLGIIGLVLLGTTNCGPKDYVHSKPGSGHNDLIVTDISDIRGYKDCYTGNFRCGLFVPRAYDEGIKYPLILYLHGYSDTTTWDLQWYHDPLAHSDPAIVLTPKCPTDEIAGWGDSWHADISPMLRNALEMLDRVTKAYHVDPDRIYVYGISMGGYGTYAALKNSPSRFAAAYVECGIGDPEMAAVLKNIPLWIFHGSDDPIVPVQGSRNMVQAILAAGGTQVRYTEYPGVKHNAWDFVEDESTLPYWLLAQRRGSVHVAPDSVPGFQAILLDGHQAKLTWEVRQNENNQDNNFWYCRIYRDACVVGEIYNNDNIFIDSTLNVGSSFSYRISAVNYFFKESPLSQNIKLQTSP